jgi:predicted Rossmann fold flavoprotein
MSRNRKLVVIGGGAAGFFAALSAKFHHPDTEVQLFESSNKLLSKVKVSGGGRCNVTHDCPEISRLAKFYPRGEKFLKKTFLQFSVKDTISWFHQRHVDLKVEEDGRMFPDTDDSQTIIDCLLKDARESGVKINMQSL